ncbi:set1/Ash2 histone methyltransferase complex subunit ASH2-like isoform X1 [Mizuhopecten yessoensis]|uniref:Set1/Ash2 histone methyltransferase complex subunit ASH2 n=2 Tax=Mizuhopecten yessoensis TaxID=6573 RepID=A0A210QNN8_MIZYE|nr:set1/Ash2 histone methyltransferase complex subunit ASH2-like isoform X1 [Mizuhopecten yessoensis]OWF50318.1 Set1/Ash2 histone methyltransferase complex subunit ASH2 [Mizuhopecten yessoensis]
MEDNAGDKTSEPEKNENSYQQRMDSDMDTTNSDAPVQTNSANTDSQDMVDQGITQIPGAATKLDSGETPTDALSLCYCGKGRNLGAVELQCGFCYKWFHSDCIGCYIGTCIPFMTNYQFSCKQCSPNGLEYFNRKQASFTQICYTTIANLTNQARNRGEEKMLFSKEKEIIPYIEKQWENLTTMARRIKTTWHTTVTKTLTKEVELFSSSEETIADPMYGLVMADLFKVGPGYELLKQGSVLQTGQKTGSLVDSKGRGTKRKAPDSIQPVGSRLKRSDVNTMAKLAPHGYPLEHPFNKDGYRYILAESDPHAPNRQAFDESLDWAGKPIPGYLYRTFLGAEVLIALNDRAPQLKVSEDRLSVTGDKGYSLIRATHGVRRGAWYYEVLIEEMPADTASRIGWSQELGNLQAPVGYDKFSYSWRSSKGTKFHQSRGKHYSSSGYVEGDVIGFFIHMPEPEDARKTLPQTYKDRPLVKFKSHLYYEEKDYVTETEKNLKPIRGSQMIMYKNGVSQGIAFEDVYEGWYYPCISLYKNTKVTVNFGPDFKYAPQGLKGFRPMSDAASQTMIEYALADILYHVENEGKLPEF